MREAGQIILFKFPKGDLKEGKLRPVLLLKKLSGAIGKIGTERLSRLNKRLADWLVDKADIDK